MRIRLLDLEPRCILPASRRRCPRGNNGVQAAPWAQRGDPASRADFALSGGAAGQTLYDVRPDRESHPAGHTYQDFAQGDGSTVSDKDSGSGTGVAAVERPCALAEEESKEATPEGRFFCV